jgi:lysyl-tRNA synthetase class 1
LGKAPPNATPEDLQTILYDVGRTIPRYQDFSAKGATPEKPGVSNAWFNSIYEILLGESKGPRFGSFIALYGIPETRALIADALAGKLLPAETVQA